MGRTLSFRMKALFRASDKESVALLMLIAATNDLRSVARLWNYIQAAQRKKSYSKTVLAGERWYAVRMGFLHLHEMNSILKSKEFKRLIERYTSRLGATKVGRIQRAGDRLNTTKLGELLRALRNKTSGHYILRVFRAALRSLEKEQQLIEFPVDSRQIKDVHLNAADYVWSNVVGDRVVTAYPAATTEESFTLLLKDILAVQEDVLNAVMPLAEAIGRDRIG